MVALDKGDGQVRPIWVGESLYRLCGRAVIKAHGAALADVLRPHQFGFAVKGGAECIVHLAHSKLRENQHTVATLDVSNAFNSVDRRHMRDMVEEYTPELLDFFLWDYGGPVVALWDNHEIISHCGVKQGGPLSPFFFALALKEPLAEAAELFPEVEVVAYLDDITVVGENSKVVKVFEFLVAKLASIGLRVNPGKTQLLFPVESAVDDAILWKELVQEEVLRAAQNPEHVIKVLGIPFGPPMSQMKVVLDTIVHGNVKLQALEKAAEDGLPPQAVMRLLANCVSRQPNFWLRCLPPVVMKEPVAIFKGRLHGLLKRVLQLPSETVLSEELVNRLDLPVKMGGLGWGLLSPEIAFVASFVASMRGLSQCGRMVWDNPFENAEGEDIAPVVPEWLQPIQMNLVDLLGEADAVFSAFKDTPKLQHRLTNKLHVLLCEKLASDKDHTMAKKCLWKCTQARGALAWVYAAPRKGFIFTPTEYAKALKFLLGLPQFDVRRDWKKVCCVNPVNNPHGSHVDDLLHHALSCGSEGQAALRDRRHNGLCRILQRAFRELKIPIDVEQPVKDGRMDIVAHMDTCQWYIDVCVNSPLSDSRLQRSSTSRLYTAKLGEKAKLAKYKELKDYDVEIHPFAIEATGGFGDYAIRLLKRLAKLYTIRSAGYGQRQNFGKLVMGKLSVCLMRHNVYMIDEYLANLESRVQ